MKTTQAGRCARFERTVGEEESAERFGNAGVRVLATPVLCHWVESAAVLCIQELLEPGEATVGTRLAIEHLAATPLGMRVTVQAELVEVDGRRLEFQAEARDAREVVARATHQRVVVDIGRFLERVHSKTVTAG